MQPDSGMADASRRGFRDIATFAPVGIFETDAAGDCVFVNRRWCQLTGLSEEHALGKGWLGALHPEDLERIEAEWYEAAASGREFTSEYRFLRPDGTQTWVSGAAVELRDAGGAVTGYLGTVTDIDEHKRAEAAVRDRDDLLRLIADEIPSLIAYVDAEQRYRFNNLAYERWFGFSREELHGKHLRELIGDEPWNAVRHHVEAALSGKEVEFEQEMRYSHGGPRFIRASYVPHRDETGRVLGYVALVNDVTEAKRAEQAVRESESRFRLAASGEALTLFEQDLDLRYTWVYPQHPEFPEQNIGRSDSELAPGEDAQRIEALKRQVIESGVGLRQEIRVPLADGVHWYDLLVEPRRDAEGTVRGVAGVAVDITERKRAEEARAFLAEATDVLTSSLDYEATLAHVARLAVPQLADWCTVHVLADDGSLRRLAVAHVDPEKVVWADELERSFPLDPDAPRGTAAVIRTGRSEFYPEISDELLRQAAIDEEHLEILRQVGFTSAMIVPLTSRDRTLGAIALASAESRRRYTRADLAVAEDLARRVALAIENAKLYRDALESSRLKDEFLATVSHELRTPLNSMLGWAKLMRAGTLTPQAAQRAVEAIERNAHAQAQIIEDLLDVSRIIAGKLRLDVRPLDLMVVTQAALDALRPAAALKGVTLEAHMSEPVQVAGDAGRLQQVVWNLLSNAIKFTPAGGRVDVRLERDGAGRGGARARLVVEDTGTGIAPEFLPYVFDRFRQEDGTTTRKHGGLGLGLAIVRHIVESHGGAVYVRSEGPGHGATFTVTLPAGSTAAAGRPGDALAVAAAADVVAGGDVPTPSLAGVHMLVVDDEPDTRDLIATVLRSAGARVVTAGSARQALELMDDEPPDLLVSDIGMPSEDGYALIASVRARPAERGGGVPAVALTAYARTEDRIRALSAGFQMHVPKPVDPVEFLLVVASLLGRYASDDSRG
jgi:PAS domain S-box-containing protein